MKLVPQQHSEAQEFHFAKKGTSVHGVAILTARPGVTAAMLDEFAATEDFKRPLFANCLLKTFSGLVHDPRRD